MRSCSAIAPGVEQAAHLDLAEQLAEAVEVDRHRLRAALGRGRVAVVDEVRDEREEDARREGRWRAGVRGRHAHAPRGDVAEQADEPRQVEDVAQALAVRLEHDWEVGVPRGDREEGRGALALRPEGGAPARVAPRQEERARGALAEARGEERGALEGARDHRLDRVGRREEQLRGRRLLAGRDAEGHPVVGVEHVGLDVPLAQARGRGDGPRREDARAERAEDDDAPVADFVDEPLEDDGAIARDLARGLDLVPHVRRDGLDGGAVERVLGAELLFPGAARGHVPHELPDAQAEGARAARPVAVPEGHAPGLAGGGSDEHAVVGDRLGAPRRGAEEEDVALAQLEHHLLVELAHAPAAARVGVAFGGEDAVEAPVGDRAAVDDRELPRARARRDAAARAVPRDARAELGEVVGGVAPAQHVEHALEGGARQLGEGRGPADAIEERALVEARLALAGRDGHDLLGEDVQRIAGICGLLDLRAPHAGRRRGARDEVLLVLGQEHAARHAADAVARAADALQARGDARRRLDLDDEVDRAHVDAQLERGRRDDGAELAALEPLLDGGALLARERAMVGQDDVLGLRTGPSALDVVERGGEALGEAAAVHEDEGRAVRANELRDARVHARPHPRSLLRARRLRAGARRVGEGRDRLDAELEALALARLDDRDRPRGGARAPDLEAAEEPRRLRDRALGGAQADALEGRRAGVADGLEALEREGEVRAALARDERVDLVDDDRLDLREALPGAGGGEEEVERLGGRDEDVAGRAEHAGAVPRGRVARAHVDRDVPMRHALRRRAGRDAGERDAQVALDVERERLERRHVEDARAEAGRVAAAAGLAGGAGPRRMSRSMATKNAASVLPDPVGARRSADSPRAIDGHTSSCAGVGPPRAARNHPAAGATKRSRGSGDEAATGTSRYNVTPR